MRRQDGERKTSPPTEYQGGYRRVEPNCFSCHILGREVIVGSFRTFNIHYEVCVHYSKFLYSEIRPADFSFAFLTKNKARNIGIPYQV